jgi:hypothetical protein
VEERSCMHARLVVTKRLIEGRPRWGSYSLCVVFVAPARVMHVASRIARLWSAVGATSIFIEQGHFNTGLV